MIKKNGAFAPTGSACRKKAKDAFLDEKQSPLSSIREKGFAGISA